MTLKAASLKTMKRGRHPDGRYGLYFNVIGNSRTWVQRLTIDGRRRNFGLGPWPVVSLSEAREIAFDNVRKRHRGIDPIAERRRAAAMPTFAQAADACIALRAGGWKAGSRNEANWRSSLAHAAPIADRPVDAIVCDDVVGTPDPEHCVPRDRPARVCKDELPHFDRSRPVVPTFRGQLRKINGLSPF